MKKLNEDTLTEQPVDRCGYRGTPLIVARKVVLHDYETVIF